MFDDFTPSARAPQARKRFGSSMAIAIAVYGAGGLALVSATNHARELVKETLTQVEFAPPPPPEPEPEVAPPPEEAPKPRAKAKRADLKPPDKVPLDKPKESDQPLAAAAPSGPVEGFLDGVAGGTGTARAAPPPPVPVKEPEKLIASKELPGNRSPAYPKTAARRGVEGNVVVAFDVRADGSVANPKIVEGPEEFHEAVLKAALTWRYQPATLGGKPVAHRRTKTVTFRLEDA
jgi:periplasmic protein TonB